MSELWPVIRFKFASALQAWHPSDQSAHVILAPWHKVGWALLCCCLHCCCYCRRSRPLELSPLLRPLGSPSSVAAAPCLPACLPHQPLHCWPP